MGLYATFSHHVRDRYPRTATDSRGYTILESYLTDAEAELHGRLGAHFTVPFSANNLTARDIVIDLTVIKMGLVKGDDLAELDVRIDKRIKALIDGTMVMVTTSGEVAALADKTGAFSTVQSYSPVFGVGDIMDMRPDPDREDDEENAR
jgi:hypothetical protein